MSAFIFCVDSSSGLPIFSRKKGNVDSLPFSIKGSLNGVHMYGKSLNLELLNTLTEDYCISWKEFEDSVILIGISSGCTKEVLNNLLTSVFNSMVLIVGIEEIKSQRIIDRLKRELKTCYPLIDRLMDSLDCGGTNNKYYSDIVGLAECILCPENHLIQILLESYMEYVDSLYSCVLINGKICVATESWWSLDPEEIKLLSLLAMSEGGTSKDIPIFLPYKSPTMAFRFVACTLIPDVQICSLCGPTPNLVEIERSVTQCFKSSTELFTAALHTHPRNFPASCQVDSGILGLLLVNYSAGKYVISKNPHQNATKKIASSSHRLDILRTFYYRMVLSFLMNEDDKKRVNVEKETTKKNDKKKVQKEQPDSSNLNVGKETYWCSEYHKCHALISQENILCVLYNSSVPTFEMRFITQRTLKALVSDKQICW